jgi:TRAP-type C4-dicarboxylate transport system substrate-binding protein
MDMIEVLGGLPTPIAWGELYTALQQRMVDGAENNPPSLVSSRHYEVAKHYTLNEHTHTPDMVLMATKTWASLDAKQKQIIEQAARESSVFQRKLWEEKSKECMEVLANAGVTIHKVDLEPFKKAVEPMIRSYDGTSVGKLIDEIRKIP